MRSSVHGPQELTRDLQEVFSACLVYSEQGLVKRVDEGESDLPLLLVCLGNSTMIFILLNYWEKKMNITSQPVQIMLNFKSQSP